MGPLRQRPSAGRRLSLRRRQILNPYKQNVLKGDYPIIGQHTFLNITAETETDRRNAAGSHARKRLREHHLPRPERVFRQSQPVRRATVFPALVRSVSRRRGIQAGRLARQAPAGVQHELPGRPGVGSRQPRRHAGPHALPRRLRPGRMVRRNEAGRPEPATTISCRCGVGSQPFTSDFRGFIFDDTNRAVRLFGTRSVQSAISSTSSSSISRKRTPTAT